MHVHQTRTIRGYQLGEVVSSLQKAVRRGQEEKALYWAAEMDRTGFGEYCWKRLKVMTAEDVGLANPHLPATIEALYQWWHALRKVKGAVPKSDKLYMTQAILLLCRSEKSRIIDHAQAWYWSDHCERLEIPDEALDHHTNRGRRMGRTPEFFFEVSSHLENPADIPDPYRDGFVALRGGKLGEPTNAPEVRAGNMQQLNLGEEDEDV